MLDELCDPNQRLYAWVAPAFSRLGALARGVIRGLRALLLLLLKNLPSESAVVRARGEDNKGQFNTWVDAYQRAWQVPAGPADQGRH